VARRSFLLAKRMVFEFNERYFLGYAGLANRYRKATSVYHPRFLRNRNGCEGIRIPIALLAVEQAEVQARYDLAHSRHITLYYLRNKY